MGILETGLPGTGRSIGRLSSVEFATNHARHPCQASNIAWNDEFSAMTAILEGQHNFSILIVVRKIPAAQYELMAVGSSLHHPTAPNPLNILIP